MMVSAASSSSSSTAEKPKRKNINGGGFVEEMRHVAMKMHTRDQAKEGESEQQGWVPLHKWEPTILGYLKFLVDSKLIYDTLDMIIQNATFLYHAEFRNTGLERAESLEKDLEWFTEQGHVIPEPSSAGLNYAQYLENIAGNDPHSFLCHFYNIYFAHTAGGRMIGRKVAEKILDKKELEFYKWDGDLSLLLQNVKEKLNRIAESWTLKQKKHCLEETEKSFKFSLDTVKLILS